jgi:hypothetical protein
MDWAKGQLRKKKKKKEQTITTLCSFNIFSFIIGRPAFIL